MGRGIEPSRFGAGRALSLSLLLPPQPTVPESQHSNTLLVQPRIAGRICLLMFWVAVLRAIKLDVELRLGAVEIEDVRPHRLLPAKLVVRKAMTAQPGPE